MTVSFGHLVRRVADDLTKRSPAIASMPVMDQLSDPFGNRLTGAVGADPAAADDIGAAIWKVIDSNSESAGDYSYRLFAPAVVPGAVPIGSDKTTPAGLLETGAALPAPVIMSLANEIAPIAATLVTDAAISGNGATDAQLLHAFDAGGLSVTGAGIKVGVLSDSFNDLGGAAADEADGALPSASAIEVLDDLASGGSDEGRAMMQIVHDIAPDATLAFCTAFNSEQDFASGILALAAAGCKVIVDDVGYSDEPFFQNGIVAQAIQAVEAEGVTYVTAAGNEAGNGYEAAWTPTSGNYDGYTLTDAESFGLSLVQTITINTEGTGYAVPLVLEWNQAYGAATSDLELLVFNSRGRLVGTATNASGGEPSNPWVEYDFTRSGTYYVAVENLSGPDPGLIKEITEGDGLPATISGANAGTVVGHSMTPGAISAGAVSVADTPAFGLSSAVSESFSSSGAGTELLFDDNGDALASPDVLSPVAVSGLDDIQTTLPGDLGDFYGTSAAAASLAGVAALILSADPLLTPAQVEQIMEETALPMSNPAVSGAGLVQVDPAVAMAQSMAGTANASTNGAVDDFNGSGVSDILWRDPVAGNNVLWTMSGGAVSATQALYNVSSGFTVAGIGAFNGGDTDDILWRNSTTGSNVVWIMSNGAIDSVNAIYSAPAGWTVAGLADFNGDGTSDVLWRNATTGADVIWTMNNGEVAASTEIYNVPSSWSIAGVGDFTGNGQQDILLRQASTGTNYIWEMSGTSIVGGSLLYNAPSDWTIAGLGNFNGNGTEDILLREASSGTNLLWMMNNGAIASSTVLNNLSSAWSVQAIADFTGNGTDDVLWRNSATGADLMWTMSNGAIGQSTALPTMSTDWSIASVGDFNGDGKADILWRDSSTGADLLWTMNGAAVTNTQALPTIAANYSVASPGQLAA